MIKIAIYDRYLSTIGGGERYSCKVAEILSRQKEFRVDLITDIFADLEKVSERLNLDLSRVNLKVFPFISEEYAKKITKRYDLFINTTYLSSLPAYSTKNIYLCYFPTPFNIDFRFIHKFLLNFFRLPAIWLFRLADKLSKGFSGIEIEEGLYEPKRFLLRRGSWSSGRVVLKVKELNQPLRIGFKNPGASSLDLMKVNIKVFEHKAKSKEIKGVFLYDKDLELGKNVKKNIEVPLNYGEDFYEILISSDTFIPVEADKSSKDTRKLGVVIYDRRRMNFFRKAILKILGYIPLFLITFPKNLKFLETYNKIITISEYSRKWIKRLWDKDSDILFPPVDVDSFRTFHANGKKEKIILSVGRFFPEHHNKKQLELSKVFIELLNKYPDEMEGYTLYLVGGVDRRTSHLEYVEKVKATSKNYPVKVITNMEWRKLVELFAKSYIFWHAAGMDEDEESHPEKFEHFGITTVEAMAAGCIPVVINKGGQKEIINDRQDGFFFDSWQELKHITLRIIGGKVDVDAIRKNAVENCRKFSNSNFEKNLISAVNEVIKNCQENPRCLRRG